MLFFRIVSGLEKCKTVYPPVKSVSDYGIKRAYVFCHANVSDEGMIRYLPVYMLMFLRHGNDDDAPRLYVPDMSALL